MGNLYDVERNGETGSFFERKLKALIFRRQRKQIEGPLFKLMKKIQFGALLFCIVPGILHIFQ